MSTSEPGVAGATPSPDGGDGARRSFGAGAVAAIAAVAFAVAAIGGYLIGHGNGEDSGRSAGYDAGVAAGRAQVERRYQPGGHGYEVIFARGRHEGARLGRARGEQIGEARGEAEGRRVGFEAGERVGIATGEAEGVRQGAAAVLGGFDDWTQGAYYIVTASPGTEAGVPFTLASRKQVEPATNYRLCADGSLCEAPVTAQPSEDGGGAGTPEADLGAGG